MPSTPHHPVGIPLTDSMRFAARDETAWWVYIEGVPPDPSSRRRRQSVLPARRLRFDSACESRVVQPVPAGSPFLTDARLQELLDRSESLHSCEPSPPAASRRWRLLDTAVERGWGEGASARRTLWSRGRQLAGGAADRVVVWVAGLLRNRPRARF